MPSKTNVTLDEHIEKYNLLIHYINEEIRKSNDPVLIKIKRKVQSLKREVPRLRRGQPSDHKRVSGFSLRCRIDDALRTFLQLDKDATPTRHEIRNAIGVYIKFNPNDPRPNIQKWAYLNPNGERNLQDEKIHSIIHPDTQLSNLLNYRHYVEQVHLGLIKGKRKNPETGLKHEVVITDDSLTYCVIQKLIQSHIIETIKD